MTRHTHQHYVKRLNDLFSVIKQLHRDSEMQEGLRASALKRRTAQLTMDYIYQVVILLHSWSELKKHTAALEKCGLYPLPSARYTLKYRIFSTLSSHRIGLFLLYCLLPLMKREK